jgi:hypothetical protein
MSFNELLATSLADPSRLTALLAEAQQELAQLTPQIEALEAGLQQLPTLKQQQHRLLALTHSLGLLLNPQQATNKPFASPTKAKTPRHRVLSALPTEQWGVFIPELAFEQANETLKRKNTINYEIFKAIVYQGGIATTDDIKAFLVAQQVRLPQTGETVEGLGLSAISARAAYLVKHGLVELVEAGRYLCKVGWEKGTTA